MRKESSRLVFSPSDLIRYVASPFSSWMDRYYLEHKGEIIPDEDSEDLKLMARTGDEHEQIILQEFRQSIPDLAEIDKANATKAYNDTVAALVSRAPLIYQALLKDDRFAGYSDFLILENGHYEVWDTKLARSPKPYYAIQLCCYAEMLAATSGDEMSKKFGIILGTKERAQFSVEDFIHYYRRVKASFLALQDQFTGDFKDRPEPQANADHGRWSSHAEAWFAENDHLVQVAGITVGQIKKLHGAGVATMEALGKSVGLRVPKFPEDTLAKLCAQARLQCETRKLRAGAPDAPPTYEVLASAGANGEPLGLAILPPRDPADVYFDMEGYPLFPGGLEYLFGVVTQTGEEFAFDGWWAHNRDEEKKAFEDFVDWVYKRWSDNPGMHIYHYASYEVSALRRLSTRHDTRQDEVDDLLKFHVFVDLYKLVRHALRIGEGSYSIKLVERLYRAKRDTEVKTATDSIVQYAQWIGNKDEKILEGIRAYNEDDCQSVQELAEWLRNLATEKGIRYSAPDHSETQRSAEKDLPPEANDRYRTIDALRKSSDPLSLSLADLIDFHRREEKPMWWRMFDRADADPEQLSDDPACIQGICAIGSPTPDKQSLVQKYQFDQAQECKLSAGQRTRVMFSHNINAKFILTELDLSTGELELRISKKSLNEKLSGRFPDMGSLIPDEKITVGALQDALTEIGQRQLSEKLGESLSALLVRKAPTKVLRGADESTLDAAIRVAAEMSGGCLVIQGPPGTGKTYTAARMVCALVEQGKRIGIASNSHKAIFNLLTECGVELRKDGQDLRGVKAGGDGNDNLFKDNPGFTYVGENKNARASYSGGIIAGTAWLFALSDWENELDFLFIDEAGQVSLANAIAMGRSSKNIVLLGDQMQLEQPIQGTHPGDAALSALHYALKDLKTSRPDAPEFHAVIPSDFGLFLDESRRMHPSVCHFISETIYEGRLGAHADCSIQKIAIPATNADPIQQEHGIVFVGVEHDGNVQKSDEEVERVVSVYQSLLGREYVSKAGKIKNLALEDFLFISPYNAQVRALQAVLPAEAKVGSVDRFQGQQAPVCILSLCSSYGEYGARGLAFILDRNRVNVAISRAQCLAIVVADPRIARADANSIDEMMLLNVFCKLVSLN